MKEVLVSAARLRVEEANLAIPSYVSTATTWFMRRPQRECIPTLVSRLGFCGGVVGRQGSEKVGAVEVDQTGLNFHARAFLPAGKLVLAGTTMVNDFGLWFRLGLIKATYLGSRTSSS